MTKLKKVALLILLCFTVVVIVFAIWYHREVSGKSVVHSEIGFVINNYKEGRAPYIDFADIESFSWDTVYVFGPYSNCKDTTKVLGDSYFLLACKISGVENYESSTLFVFKKNDRIVKWTTFASPRIQRSNEDGHYESGYLYEQSTFVLNENGYMIWVEK